MPYVSQAQQRYINMKASQGDPKFVKVARDFNTATYGRPGFTARGARTGASGDTKGGAARYAGLPSHVPHRKGGAVAQSNFDRLAARLGQRPGVSNPRALAAAIGRRKYGASTMGKAAARGVPAASVKRGR